MTDEIPVEEAEIIDALSQALNAVNQSADTTPDATMHHSMMSAALALAYWLRTLRAGGMTDDEVRERLAWIVEHAHELTFTPPEGMAALLGGTQH